MPFSETETQAKAVTIEDNPKIPEVQNQNRDAVHETGSQKDVHIKTIFKCQCCGIHLQNKELFVKHWLDVHKIEKLFR